MTESTDPTGAPPSAVELEAVVRRELARVLPDLARWSVRSGEAEEKGSPHDLVTAYDREVEQRLRSGLVEGVPGSAFVGEEAGASGLAEANVRWHVDPIDGTGNFIAGIPFFSVSIAAEVAGEVVAAVVADPMRDEVFAWSGGQVRLNDIPAPRGSVDSPLEAVLLSNAPYEGRWATGERITAFGEALHRFRAVRRLGSTALELAYVAVGRADIAAAHDVGWWDVAAGGALVRASGGATVADGPTASWAVRSFIATAPGLDPHDPVLTRLVT